jgi:hypothetical protein
MSFSYIDGDSEFVEAVSHKFEAKIMNQLLLILINKSLQVSMTINP